MSTDGEKTAIARKIKAAYPWLDEQHIEYYAEKAIQNKKSNEYH